MKKRIETCPSCGEKLEVRELGCPACNVLVRGVFDRCEFCSLSDEHLAFLRLFVSRRGNLREVERELGLSYPTVRARFDDVLRALGYEVNPVPAQDRQEHRQQILDELKNGVITPEEAARALRE
jgi:hypothetical protein